MLELLGQIGLAAIGVVAIVPLVIVGALLLMIVVGIIFSPFLLILYSA